MMGMISGSGLVFNLDRRMAESASGRWIKKRGMVVMPKSTKPLTPIFELLWLCRRILLL